MNEQLFMGVSNAILVIGASGAGKTYAIRNCDPKTTTIICPDQKALPWKGWLNDWKAIPFESNISYDSKSKDPIEVIKQYGYKASGNIIPVDSMFAIKSYMQIINDKKKDCNLIIIDTVSHAMLKSMMNKLYLNNYDKFKEFADELFQLVKMCRTFRQDLTVIFTAHYETADDKGVHPGKKSFKVPAGKLTREAIEPESMFTVVLWSEKKISEGKVIGYFDTIGDGFNTAKTPVGMFPTRFIDNDYDYVRKCIEAYNKGEDIPKQETVISISNF